MLAGTSSYQSLCSDIQAVLQCDFSHIPAIITQLQQLSPTQLDQFFSNRLYGLLLSFLFNQLLTFQFGYAHFLDIIVQFLYFLLTKENQNPMTQQEPKDLLMVMRLCTCRDAVRFKNEKVKEFLLKECKSDGETVSSIAWFYREYMMQWLSYVRIIRMMYNIVL